MRHPCPIMPGMDLAEFVLANLVECSFVRDGIVLDRNLSSHSAHGMNTPSMARLDKQVDIGLQEMFVHSHGRPVGQHEVRPRPELLNETENVVPASAIQTRRMFS